MYPAPPVKAANLWLAPNLLSQKFPAIQFAVTTRLDFSSLAEGEKAGIIILGLDYSYLAVERVKGGFQLAEAVCKDAPAENGELQEQTIPFHGDSLWLRVAVGLDAQCRFSYSHEGEHFTALGKPFAAREGKWIGGKAGLFCAAAKPGSAPGHADFDCFRFTAG